MTMNFSIFFCNHASGQVGITGYILMEEAHSIGREGEIDEISLKKIENSWINRFKARRGIVSKKLHGEAADRSRRGENMAKRKKIT